MQFRHPEFLYFLFLLVIPIIVHLFQLRKFQKTPFTNVAFLKKVVFQTRKSAALKKWLTLLARLFALACIVLAFAQPFVPQEKVALQPKETVIYLDNSFSMQLEGKRGELLKRAIQEILENIPTENKFTLLTNDRIYKNTTIPQLKKELMQLEYSGASPTLNTILFRAKNEFSSNPSTRKTFIAISDFQANSVALDAISTKEVALAFIQLTPVNTDNASIDSVFISEKDLGKYTLTALLSYTGNKPETVPVALYDGTALIAKTSAHFDKDKTAEVNLTLNPSSGIVKGKVILKDQGLQYDNTFYFTINKSEKIKVVALGESQDQNQFLKRIYDEETFDFLSFEKGSWDYNKIATANTVILNGLKTVPAALLPILEQLVNNQGHLVVIPPTGNNLEGYQTLFLRLEAPSFTAFIKEEQKITDIVFEHPLYDDVFDDRVENFQYPSVQSSWKLGTSGQSILKFSDASPFLTQDHNLYIFTASLDPENSNFKNSPLIVPTFYNIAKQSLKAPELYYSVGKKAVYSVNAQLRKDEIVVIENKNHSFIPAQQNTGKQIQITTETRPNASGIYNITKEDQVLRGVAYNYDRKESDLTYANLAPMENIVLSTDVETFFTQQKEQNEIHALWKWFVIFAIFFLLVELLLLKYLK